MNIKEAMAQIIGNDFVSFGGFINGAANTTNHTYARDITIANSPWRRMDDMPLAISVTHAPTVRIGSKVYMCGGYLGGHPGPHAAFCLVYDHTIPAGAGQQWTRFADLPNNGYAGSGMIYDTARNTLYFAGGGQRLEPGNPHPVDSNRTFKYSLQNPSAGWVETTPIPYAANHISSVTQTYLGQERHYFVGGQKGENEAKQNLADMYEFIASSESWVKRTFMPFGRGHATASTRPIGCGFVVAGGSINGATSIRNRTKSVIYYDIPSDRWTEVGELSQPRVTALVDIHSNGYMYYVGVKETERRRFAVP
jgi:N-acetylneuraminic acid mutarotase